MNLEELKRKSDLDELLYINAIAKYELLKDEIETAYACMMRLRAKGLSSRAEYLRAAGEPRRDT